MDFDKAIRLGVEGLEVYESRGFTHLKLAQYKHAVQDFDEAIRSANIQFPEEYQITDFRNITDDHIRIIVAPHSLLQGRITSSAWRTTSRRYLISPTQSQAEPGIARLLLE